ncbi:MAG: universal stress protein, partial [Moraxellaceae bacterium]|nr:universal stress protein [Moraxellaceae bacterium]
VKSRVWPYEEILVATDLSEPSEQALLVADRFFPTAPLTALHVADTPPASILETPALREQWRAREKAGCAGFIERSKLSAEARLRVKPLVDCGRPEVVVRRYMLEKEVDLVVVGSRRGGSLFDKRLGGVARRILEYAPADVLLIRDPRTTPREPPSH